jgi:hypothetical protein
MTVPGEPRLKEGTPVPDPMTEISIVLSLLSIPTLAVKKISLFFYNTGHEKPT